MEGWGLERSEEQERRGCLFRGARFRGRLDGGRRGRLPECYSR